MRQCRPHGAEPDQESRMVLKIERFQPEGMNVRMSGGKPSYSHVVTVSGSGKIVYTAGQLARDIDGNCVGKGDMRAQMEQTFQNLDRCLKVAGATWADVVKTNTCHRLRRVPEVRRHPHALSRGGDPDQHDRRRYPSRRTRFYDRDRGRRRRQFLRSGSGPTLVRRRPGKPNPRSGETGHKRFGSSTPRWAVHPSGPPIYGLAAGDG